MKRKISKLLSGILTLGLIATMLPGMSMTAKAATNYNAGSTGTLPTHVKAYDDSNKSTNTAITDIQTLGTIENGIEFYLAAEDHYVIADTPAPSVTYTCDARGLTTAQDATVEPVSGKEGVYRVTVPAIDGAQQTDVFAFTFNATAKPIEHTATVEFEPADAGTASDFNPEKPNETENYTFKATLNEGYMFDTGHSTTPNVGTPALSNYDATSAKVTLTGTGNQLDKDFKVTIKAKKKAYDVAKDGAVTQTLTANDTSVSTTGDAFEHGTAITLKDTAGKATQIEYTVTPVKADGSAGTEGPSQMLTGSNGTFDLGKIEGDIMIKKVLEAAQDITVAHGQATMPAGVDTMKGKNEIPQNGDPAKETAKTGEDYTFTITLKNTHTVKAADAPAPKTTITVTVGGVNKVWTNDGDDSNDALTVDYSKYPEIKVTVKKEDMTGNITAINVENLTDAVKISAGEGVDSVDVDGMPKDKDGNVIVPKGWTGDVTLTAPAGKTYATGATTDDGKAINSNKVTLAAADTASNKAITVKETNADGSPTGNIVDQVDPGNGGTTSGNGQPEDASTPGSAGPGNANSPQGGTNGDGSNVDTGFADNDQIADYAKPFVKAAADAGIIKGVGNNRFDPLGTATRAQFATMIARAKGLTAKKESSKFADVAKDALGEDLFNGVLACEDLDPAIVQGYPDNSFQPGKAVSRAEGILMIWRAAGSPAYTGADKFNDLADWYKDAANWGAEQGIVNGVGNNMFNGSATLTRQDLATMLGRAIQKGVITPEQAQDNADKANTEDKTDEKSDAAAEGDSSTDAASEEKTEETKTE